MHWVIRIALASLALPAFADLPPAPKVAVKFQLPIAVKGKSKDLAKARNVFATRCVVCHGAKGAGDGVAAIGMSPKPRAFSDAAWQKTVTDSALFTVIKGGGPAAKKSPLMPANPDLSDDEVHAMVALIRAQRGQAVIEVLGQGKRKSKRGATEAVVVATVSALPTLAGTLEVALHPGRYKLAGFFDLNKNGKRDKGEASFGADQFSVSKDMSVSLKLLK